MLILNYLHNYSLCLTFSLYFFYFLVVFRVHLNLAVLSVQLQLNITRFLWMPSGTAESKLCHGATSCSILHFCLNFCLVAMMVLVA